MDEYGHQDGTNAGRNDVARSVFARDMAYFAQHPDETEFVRRIVPGEQAEHLADDPELADAWADVQWVLVTTLNEQRRGRIRIPLRAGYPQLTDGAR
jgi:hypothetical protein